MDRIMKCLMVVTLALGLLVGPLTTYTPAQDAPNSGQPTVTSPAEPTTPTATPAAEAGDAPTANPAKPDADDKLVSKAKDVEVSADAPTWIQYFGKAWPIILTLLGGVLLYKVVKDEAWRSILRAGLMGVDQVYLAYVQPAKDPNNKDVEWDQAKARAKAWAAAKKQAGIFVKLIFAVKGKDWGETLMHRLANRRAGKTASAEK